MGNYALDVTILEARQQYFRENGFGEDGGYNKKVDWFSIGPLKLPIFNIPARIRAIRYHDLHHILTGYHTDWRGEFEISAWEIGAGCGREWFAWLINLGGMAGGLMLMPKETSRAFFRGRHSRSLYRYDFSALPERKVREIRAETGVDQPVPDPFVEDWWALLRWSALAMLWALAHLAVPAVLLGWLFL